MAEANTRELQTKVGKFLDPPSELLPTDLVRQSAVEVLTRTVRKGWRTYLVGGFLRDVVVRPHSHWPRDFDVIVEGCSWEELSQIFVDIISGYNRFGGLTLRRHMQVPVGYRARTQELDFDVWRLEDTWAVRHLALPRTIHSFVQTPFLNVDSIAISIGPGNDYLTVFEHGFFDALKRRYVEVNQTDNPYPVLCAVRGLIMAATLGFAVGPKLAAFVYEQSLKIALEEFVAAQVGHYGHVRFSREQVKQWILDIRTQLDAGREQVHLTAEPEDRAPLHERSRYLHR